MILVVSSVLVPILESLKNNSWPGLIDFKIRIYRMVV